MAAMNADTQRALAEYKAQIDAKYSRAGTATTEELARRKAEEDERKRKDRWLLVNPSGQIVGVLVRWCAKSAIEAFEDFYPNRNERLAAAAEGYHIEEDDKDGTRFEQYCADVKAGRA